MIRDSLRAAGLTLALLILCGVGLRAAQDAAPRVSILPATGRAGGTFNLQNSAMRLQCKDSDAISGEDRVQVRLPGGELVQASFEAVQVTDGKNASAEAWFTVAGKERKAFAAVEAGKVKLAAFGDPADVDRQKEAALSAAVSK